MVCTEPLPKDRVPMIVARLWSCSAPATISEAEAEPPLISTTIGLPLVRSPAARVVALGLVGVAAAGGDDLAALEEGVGHRDRLVEQAAGIVAQVEHVALELVVADVLVDLLDRRSSGRRGLLVELGDADIAESSPSLRDRTERMRMTSRVSVTLERISRPCAVIVSMTGVFTGPRILSTAWLQRQALHRLAVDLR